MQKIEVLLADDHAIIRHGLKQALADTEDISVEGEAANGNEVLLRVRERNWGVVILDISMPGHSGLDLIKILKEEKPELKILILSMHHEEQYALRALHAGASGYLTKESDSEVLISAIRRIAGGGLHVSHKVAELMVRDIRPSHGPLPHPQLSEREYQVFNMLVSGLGLTEVGPRLSLRVKTINPHKSHVLEKMKPANMGALIRYAIAHQPAEISRSWENMKTTLARLTLALSSTAFLTLSTGAIAAVDADAAKALAKKNDCFKCHAIDKTKKGPSYQKIAAKYKGKEAEGEQKMFKNITTAPKVKLEDGSEEDHKIIDTKDQAEIKNLIYWILAQ